MNIRDFKDELDLELIDYSGVGDKVHFTVPNLVDALSSFKYCWINVEYNKDTWKVSIEDEDDNIIFEKDYKAQTFDSNSNADNVLKEIFKEILKIELERVS